MSRPGLAWKTLLGSVEDAFVCSSSVVLFCELMSAWVLTTARRTICQMVAVMDPATRRAHDAYHRLVRESAWSLDQAFVAVCRLVVRLVATEGRLVLYLDDTLFHRNGPKVEGAGVFRDAVRSTKRQVVYARGLNLVVIGVRVDPPWGGMPLCLPVAVRLHEKDGPTMPELAAQMMAELAVCLPEASFVLCGDGAYATLAGTGLERTMVVSRMRRDAALSARLRSDRARPVGLARGASAWTSRPRPPDASRTRTSRRWNASGVGARPPSSCGAKRCSGTG